MNRLTLFGILWSLAIAVSWAQEVATPTEKSSPAPIPPVAEPTFESLPADLHAVDLILDADARESDVVKQVVEALEKAGIAKGKPAETTPLLASSIGVTLGMRQDESYEKITQLIEALEKVGVQQISVGGKGAVRAAGGKEQNYLTLQVAPRYSTDELSRIQRAARTAAKQCGLPLVMATRGLEVPENEEIFTSPERASGEKRPLQENASMQIQQQVAHLKVDYETANKQAHDLARSLRHAPDAGKQAELRAAVLRAFTSRQSLLRAELVEMQTRLENTQHSLDMRERIADQIVDRRVEDLLNPHMDWEQTSSGELKNQSELKPPVQPESSVVDDSGVVTELEGDWHRVAYIDKWQTERRPINVTIRANQWTATHWTGESVSRSLIVDEDSRTIDFGSMKVKNGLPNEIVSERGTYKLTGDILTIHSEYTCTDSVSGTLVQKGQHTNIWKRGLCEIPDDYDSRNPGHGMGFFYLNGNDENTGHGKLIPGDKVDVLVSLKLPNGTPQQLVLAENLEVDGSSEPTENSQRQMRLVGTREQCLLLQHTVKQETMSLRTRKPNDETLQFPDGINREAFKELDAAASPIRDLDPTVE